MPLEEQLVSEATKQTKGWLHKQGQMIYEMMGDDTVQKEQDRVCWNLYNEKMNEGDFNYLTQIDDTNKNKTYVMPAKVRHVGIVRPRLNQLISKQARRDFHFSVVSVDKESVTKKYRTQILNVAKEIDDRVSLAYNAILAQIETLEMQKAQLQQLLQQEPQNEQAAIEAQKLQTAMPMIQMQFRMISGQLEREKSLTEEELKEIELRMRYTHKDYRESLAQKSLHHLREVLRAKEESRQAFIEKLVVGKEAFYVDYLPGNKYPIYQKLSTEKVYFPKGGRNSWIQHGQWVAIKDYWTPSQVLDEYSKYLTDDQKKDIEGRQVRSSNANNMNSYARNNATFEGPRGMNHGVYSGSGGSDAVIEVVRLWWKSQRKETMKKSPNKHREGKEFTNYVKEGDRDKPLRSGEEVHERYINDIYQGVILDGEIKIKFAKKNFVLRPIDNPSHVELPVYGQSFNDSSESPYSLIWATKDIQVLYNLVCYHEELLLALSGVKGFIMDRSQKPDDMSDAEWAYQRKVGTGWIQTIKKGNRVNPVYNQFATYDDTLSQAVVTLNQLKDKLIESVRDITGVTRESEGATVPSDQVGTYRMSQAQSSLITEYLFYEHDVVESRALKALVNIDAYIVSQHGDVRHYFDNDKSQVAFDIPKGVLDKANYDILVTVSPKDEQDYQELKGLATAEHSRGVLGFNELLEVYNTPILTDLQKKLENFADIAQARLEGQAQASNEAIAQGKQADIELKGEYDKAIQDSKNQLEQLKIQLEDSSQKWQQQKDIMDNSLKEKELASKEKLGLFKIATENTIESEQLSNNDKHQTIDEIIRIAEMRINAALTGASISKDLDVAKMKKTEDKVGPGQPREKVKDN